MQTPHDPDIDAVWQQLCTIFAARRPLFPRWKEFLPSLFNWQNDQITWHRKRNISWQDATTRMDSRSTAFLQTLDRLATENLGHHNNSMSVTATFFASLTAFLLFLYQIARDFILPIVSHSDLWSLLLERTADWVILLIMLAAYLYTIAKIWNSKQQARELASCIRVTLALRLAADESRHPAPST